MEASQTYPTGSGTIMRQVRGVFQDIWRFHAMFLRHPVLALACIPAYLMVAAIVIAGMVCIVLASDAWLREHTAIPTLCLALCILTLIALCADLVLIQFLAVAAGISFGSDRHELARVAQAILMVVVIFAAIYYYFQLFSQNKAFNNMTPVVVDSTGFTRDASFFYQAILQVPPTETIIDCLYFSVITITTVGYGDIHPATSYAKLLCMLEIILGYLLLVLSIGAIASNPKNSGEASSSEPMARA